jgi:hypothetical protein
VDPELKNVELEVDNTAAGFDGNVSGGNVSKKIDTRDSMKSGLVYA